MTEENNFDFLIIQGAKYKTTLTGKYKNRTAWKEPNHNLIYSHMPGTVIEIRAKANQKIRKGETLMVLEAMKMYNNVLMPFDGEIVQINVKPADIIPKNHLMIEVRQK